MIETIVSFAIVMLIVGLVCYLFSLTPFQAWIKQAFYAVVVVITLIYVLRHYVE